MFTAAIITASDKGYAGLREDKSGQAIEEILTAHDYKVIQKVILPDDKQILAEEMKRLCDEEQVNLLLTTGGTGFSPRDITPEATAEVCERMVPGIAEAMRAYSLTITPRAMLSRAASGIRKKTLIVNLPGSEKAVRESLEYIIDPLGHGLDILLERDGECGR